MDIELARTFLEITRGGSFIAAAERLHVTQTAITARVQKLEAQLGCSLFVRNRAGARLTANGEKFIGYASQLVQSWELRAATCRCRKDAIPVWRWAAR